MPHLSHDKMIRYRVNIQLIVPLVSLYATPGESRDHSKLRHRSCNTNFDRPHVVQVFTKILNFFHKSSFIMGFKLMCNVIRVSI